MLCGRPPRYAPTPVTLTFDLLILKMVSKSRRTWATSVPISLGLSVLDLCPMYATDREDVRQTDVRRQSASSLIVVIYYKYDDRCRRWEIGPIERRPCVTWPYCLYYQDCAIFMGRSFGNLSRICPEFVSFNVTFTENYISGTTYV